MVTLGQVNSAAAIRNVDTQITEQHVFYVGVDGSLNQTWWDGNTWHSQVLPGAPASDPVVLFQPFAATTVDVYFRDINGRLGHTFWTLTSIDGSRRWITETIPGAPVGNVAAGTYVPFGQGPPLEHHIFYVEADGALHQTWGKGDSWASQPLPGNPGNPTASNGGPSVLSYDNGSVTEQHVFYVGQDGKLWQSWWNQLRWNTEALPGTPPQGPPSAIECDNNENLMHALFTAPDPSTPPGGIPITWTVQQSWWDGAAWRYQTLPGIAGDRYVLAAALNETSHLPFAPTRIQQHVFYRGSNGALGHSWWTGQRWYSEWLAGEPERLLGVFPYYENTAPELHVFIRGLDPSLWHLWWNGSAWQSDTVPTATPVRI